MRGNELAGSPLCTARGPEGCGGGELQARTTDAVVSGSQQGDRAARKQLGGVAEGHGTSLFRSRSSRDRCRSGRGKAMCRAFRLADGRKALRAPGGADTRCAPPVVPAGPMRRGRSGLRRSADMRLPRHRRRRGPSPRPREGRRRLSPSQCGGRRTRTRAHP